MTQNPSHSVITFNATILRLITIICNHILSYDKLSTSSWYIHSHETETLKILNSEEVYLSIIQMESNYTVLKTSIHFEMKIRMTIDQARHKTGNT